MPLPICNQQIRIEHPIIIFYLISLPVPTMQKWDYQMNYITDKSDSLPAELYDDRKFISHKKPIHPKKIPSVLEEFKLSTEQLDVRGDIDFNQKQPQDVRIRGGMEYYKPTVGIGYGINIGEHTDKFQKWAVCFHGVKVLPAIPKILKEGLKPGPGQGYAGQKDVCGEVVIPTGIYVTPYLHVTMGYVNHAKKLVVQCLVNPSAMLMATQKDYWIVKDPANLIPYRIIHVP